MWVSVRELREHDAPGWRCARHRHHAFVPQSDSRAPDDELVMLIGSDVSGRMLEIGVAQAEGIEFIVHAMPARSKFTR